jgi:molybdopterin-guanine dinucleotide biosynthesis protein A
MIADCTAIILAGGESKRMGRDKAALPFNGETLLQRVIACVQPLFVQTLVSVRQPRADVALPQICDMQADSGPLAGLVSTLESVTTPWVFVVACDMPFVTAKVVERLAEFRSQLTPLSLSQEGSGLASSEKWRSGEAQAVVPMIDGYPQPLTAFYARAALDEMRASLAAGDKSLRGMLQRLNVCYVSEAALRDCDPQLRSFFDLDTPQDYLAAQEQT